jgi:hypothetical protein
MLCPSSWLYNTNLEKAIKGQAEELTLLVWLGIQLEFVSTVAAISFP